MDKQYLKYKTKYVVGGAIPTDDIKVYHGIDPLYKIDQIVIIRVETIEGDTVYPAGTTGRILQYITSGETFQYLIQINDKIRLYFESDIVGYLRE